MYGFIELHNISLSAVVYNRHFLICLYGAVILGFILAGELKERKVVYILTGYSSLFRQPAPLFIRNHLLTYAELNCTIYGMHTNTFFCCVR